MPEPEAAPHQGRAKEEILYELRNAAVCLAALEPPKHLPGSAMACVGVRCFDLDAKGSYKMMLLLTHPDKHGDSPESTEGFKSLGKRWNNVRARQDSELAALKDVSWRFDEELLVMTLWREFKDLPPPGVFTKPPLPTAKGKAKDKEPPAAGADVPDIVYDIREELISKKAILEFLTFTAARRARHHSKGSVAVVLETLLRRGRPVFGNPDLLALTVISYRATSHHGLLTRRQTGIRVFKGQIPDDVAAAVKHEVDRGIFRGSIGKSPFHVGDRLTRVVCRHGLGMVDLDLQRCYTHLRHINADEGISRDRMAELCANPVEITEKLASMEGISAKSMKQRITAAANMQALAECKCVEVFEWLKQFKAENGLIIRSEIAKRPELHGKFLAMGKHNADLAFMSAIDADREAVIVDRFDCPEVGL